MNSDDHPIAVPMAAQFVEQDEEGEIWPQIGKVRRTGELTDEEDGVQANFIDRKIEEGEARARTYADDELDELEIFNSKRVLRAMAERLDKRSEELAFKV